MIPPFQGGITIDLPVACTFDLTVASAKYFNGLEQGEAPLCLLFSGTIFHQNAAGALQIAQIPWTKEAHFGLPAETWQQLMELPLSQPGMAVPAPRRLRAAEPVQAGARNSDLGTGAGERAAMNLDLVERVAEAVLYEGYMLYPYTASSVKNQKRFNFGVLVAARQRDQRDADRVPGGCRRANARSASAYGSCRWATEAKRSSGGWKPRLGRHEFCFDGVRGEVDAELSPVERGLAPADREDPKLHGQVRARCFRCTRS